MLIPTILASSFYASIHIMPAIKAGNTLPPLRPTAPFALIQATEADLTSPGSETPRAAITPFPISAQFETADTWVSEGRRYRLYGVQACLRGTRVTVVDGSLRDCGELNVIMAQAIIRDTRPVCEDVKDIDQNNAVVVCQTTSGKNHYDLATYLIAQGWGFAAVDDHGQLIVPGYRIAEESARSARAGLWASSDLPHPVSVLRRHGGAEK